MSKKCEDEHDHSHEEPQSGFEQTLFPWIDTTKSKYYHALID
jgi:hypothetical protein